MRKRIENRTTTEKRLLSIGEVCTYLGVGQAQARKYMDEIGAVKKFGRRVVFDKLIIDTALNNK